MNKIRLRTKFLLSLLAISAGLTAATLLIVSYSVRKRVRENIREELRNSVASYQSFASHQEEGLAHSAVLLGDLPNVRALMTTGDEATIQDASADVWMISGSDLLALAGRDGKVAALRANTSGLDSATVQGLLRNSLDRGDSGDWWFLGGHLYEVRLQPIYLGAASRDTMIGLLALGREFNESVAKEFSSVASSEVTFNYGGTPVTGTLNPDLQSELAHFLADQANRPSAETQEIPLGSERYLAETVPLSPEGAPLVSLTVLKSFDKATEFLDSLNRILLGLGLLTIVAGSALVFWISHTFTRPLASLVGGVRALGQGDYRYPLEPQGGDEVSEVTDAFVRMRASLESSQLEQKQLEERLRQAHKMEAVGRLAGGIAHDFNNLLTIIRGNTDLLMDREGADDLARKCVGQIQKASSRAVSMTRQLLAFSRMQVLQPRVIDLNTVLAELGKMLPRLIGEHIEYSFDADPRLEAVKADPGQIEQVILNLAANARDAMPRGGKLTVRTANASIGPVEAAKRAPMSPGQYVLITVADTGHGMDEATIARIFEPFFTTKELGKGTGLGLATVYGIVKQSGGFIWVVSSPESGATFEIYLPRAAGSAVPGAPKESLAEARNGNETILVVEDEPGVRELACQFLRVKGYGVLAAASGQEALDAARQYPGTIHLLLSDMIMPHMNGEDLAGQLKAARPEMRVAFMSGYSEFSRGELGRGFPEAPLLQKPFSPASLVEIVREALDRPLPAPAPVGAVSRVS